MSDQHDEKERRIGEWLRRGRSKYNAKRTEIDGIKFDSLREARFYHELKLREKAGEVCGIAVHPAYTIEHNGQKICRVVLDFRCYGTDNRQHNVDVKGLDTPVSRLKRRLLKAFYGIDVEIIR